MEKPPYEYRRYDFDVALVAPIVQAAEEAAFEHGRSTASNRVALASARLAMWGDAVSSCRMEGVDARAAADPVNLTPGDFAAMRVSRAAAFALMQAQTPGPKPQSLARAQSLREIHLIAMTGVGLYGESAGLEAGQFRDHAAVIRRSGTGDEETSLGPVVHVGSSPKVLPLHIARWSRDFAPGPQHPIVRAGLAHLTLEKIHPFSDGNGRVGRILASGMLAEAGYPCTTISRVINRRRDLYYAGLAGADKGDATQWLQVFTGAAWEAVSGRAELDRKVASEMHTLLDAAGTRSIGVDALVTELVSMPVATARALAARTGLGGDEAMSILERLAGDGHVELTRINEGAIVRVPSVIALAEPEDSGPSLDLARRALAEHRKDMADGEDREQGKAGAARPGVRDRGR